MSLFREVLEIFNSPLSERVVDHGDREHEYDPKEFDDAANYVGGHRMATRNDPDPDYDELGAAARVLRDAAKSAAGSGAYDDAAAVLDKLKKDNRFSSKLKHIGKGLPDDKRIDKKPREVSDDPEPKPFKPVADRPDSRGYYDEDDIKDVVAHLDKKYPGKWPFRSMDPRTPLRQALKDGPGSSSWKNASDVIDNAKGTPQLGLPQVSRKPDRPGGKLGALLKQADQAKQGQGKEHGRRGAEVGEVRKWADGSYKKTTDGWVKIKK